jgi:hypothetical protein
MLPTPAHRTAIWCPHTIHTAQRPLTTTNTHQNASVMHGHWHLSILHTHNRQHNVISPRLFSCSAVQKHNRHGRCLLPTTQLRSLQPQSHHPLHSQLNDPPSPQQRLLSLQTTGSFLSRGVLLSRRHHRQSTHKRSHPCREPMRLHPKLKSEVCSLMAKQPVRSKPPYRSSTTTSLPPSLSLSLTTHAPAALPTKQ